ncbi:unnamed protein product [Adineta ricciae]|uniref:Uncharacterized protein n=1 Tax=Adineta ricciae TaxID=249248 RepID=A0A815WB83_ADIRI|nr:unnamed protein product [Adineta ricciae]
MEQKVSFSSCQEPIVWPSEKCVALITGANKGIGFEVARQLGRKGILVLVGSRDLVKGSMAMEKLKIENIFAQLMEIDVTNQQTIDRAVARVEKEYGHLDILINNAAVQHEGEAPSETKMEKLHQTFEANFFGVFSVTKAFIPLLQKSPNGARIINVSSQLDFNFRFLGSFGNHIKGRNKLAYSCSKAALNMMTYQFAKEFQDKRMRITINSVDPV